MKEIYLILQRLLDIKLKKVSLDYKRDLFYKIDFSRNIIWIYGERWIWKTTLLLQKLKETWWFYFSCDNPVVQDVDLFSFVDYLVNDLQIEYVYIDEIHKNPNWINSIKAIYDLEFNAKIIFSWSSSLDLYKWTIDLWRRAKFYNMHTLNYWEFLNLFYDEKIDYWEISLEDILQNHEALTIKYGRYYSQWRFEKYIERWFYPFSADFSFEDFIQSMQEIWEKIILEDLPTFKVFKSVSLIALKKIFYYIANNKPSDLSFLSLSKKIWVDKKILEDVLHLLDKIWVVHLIPKFWSLSDTLRKEYKVFLWNPNLYYVWSLNPDIWTIRESFFISQIKKIKNIEIFSAKKGDFLVKYFDKEYVFEIWWKSKTNRQISWLQNAYIVKDNIISWERNIIPLWMFGFLD